MSVGLDGLVSHGRVDDLVNLGAVTFVESKFRYCGYKSCDLFDCRLYGELNSLADSTPGSGASETHRVPVILLNQ